MRDGKDPKFCFMIEVVGVIRVCRGKGARGSRSPGDLPRKLGQENAHVWLSAKGVWGLTLANCRDSGLLG